MRAFNEFLASGDQLRVYEGGKLIFSSTKERLLPLMDYIDGFHCYQQTVIIFDRIIGNAAALLSIKAGCQEVCSPLGSQLAVETLDKYGIKYQLGSIVPYIRQPHRDEICPMEKLSIDKGPEEFWQLMVDIINRP
jgi:hypothetical protein